jgi:hypothetical protein
MIETMLKQAMICFLFLVLWNSGVGGSGNSGSGIGGSGFGTKQITTRFTPTEKKPNESEKIFSLGTPTESQCLYICNQNRKCLAIQYNKLRSFCNGYKSKTATEPLSMEEKAWIIFYEGL